MSAALSGDETSDYASNYMRVHGEMAVRWAAVEVLEQSKYSRASHVWSYGAICLIPVLFNLIFALSRCVVSVEP
jgi:hypothetical protein